MAWNSWSSYLSLSGSCEYIFKKSFLEISLWIKNRSCLRFPNNNRSVSIPWAWISVFSHFHFMEGWWAHYQSTVSLTILNIFERYVWLMHLNSSFTTFAKIFRKNHSFPIPSSSCYTDHMCWSFRELLVQLLGQSEVSGKSGMRTAKSGEGDRQFPNGILETLGLVELSQSLLRFLEKVAH